MERMGKHSSAEFDRIQRQTLVKYAKWDADTRSLAAYKTIEGFCQSRCLERGAWTKPEMDTCLSICIADLTTNES
jgi:hypothetical protein